MTGASLCRAENDQAWWHIARLACACAAGQLGLHAWFAVSGRDPWMIMPHLVAWVLDTFVLLVLAAILIGASTATGRVGLRRQLLRRTGSVVVIAAGLLLASYPGLLAEFLAQPVNAFHADAATAWFFVSECLGWYGLWPLLVPAAVAGLVARSRWYPPRRPLLFASVIVTVFSAAALFPPAPQPLVYALQDSLRGWLSGNHRVVPSLPRSATATLVSGQPAATESPLGGPGELRYDHVLVFVMEGVTSTRFERYFRTQPDGYFATVQDRSVYFDHYFTTNLDSYTSLIAMLTSVQVPYRAYADPRGYEPVNDAPNLAAALRRRGFETLFVSTSRFQPFIPVPEQWSQILAMRDLPWEEGWVTVGGSKVEAAVEDRAALPAILDFVMSHPKTLVLQEMVFGHSPRWTAKTGLRQLEYYDKFLLQLLGGLRRAGLADKALVIVLSDHGDRAGPSNVDNYRVPLLVSGYGVPPGRRSECLSHKDFQGVIGHFLAGRPFPKPRKSVLIVGSTERWVYGEIVADGGYVFIDNSSGAVLASHGGRDATLVYQAFRQSLQAFAARFHR